jgi:hypothetical protein
VIISKTSKKGFTKGIITGYRLGHLTKLYYIIETLMGATFKADQELKSLLATLEYKARKCKEFIEQRTAVRN